MLPENKNNTDKFDKFLKDSLKQYCSPVPADFPKRMLDNLRQFEQQEALRRIIWQERMLLAACILLPVAGIILILMFPNILLVPTQLYEAMCLLTQKAMADIIQQWQLWIYYIMSTIAVLYALYEVLLADN